MVHQGGRRLAGNDPLHRRRGATLAKLGATIEEIELPDYELYNACGRVIMFSEAYAIHEKDFQTRPSDYGLYTYLRMSMGAFARRPI